MHFSTLPAHLALYAERERPTRTSDTTQAEHRAEAAATAHVRALATREKNDDETKASRGGVELGCRDALEPRMMAAPTTPAYNFSPKRDDEGRWRWLHSAIELTSLHSYATVLVKLRIHDPFSHKK